MENILVALNLDKYDQALLNQALHLAKAFSSKIWVVHIAAPDPDFVGYEVGPQYIRDLRAEELRNEHKRLQAHAYQLQQQGVEAEGLLIQGATTQMVIEESHNLQASLIVMGHQHHGFLYKVIIGSTASSVIEKSKIPVLIVPLED